MFGDMGDREFVDFLAALWESRGWETGVTERDEGVYMITGDKEDGQRGLMMVVPGTDETVTGQELQQLVSLVDDKMIDMGVAATRGACSEDATGIADANGIHLLDTDTLEQTVASEGLHDLVEEFSGDGGGDGGSLVARLPSISFSLPAVGGLGSGLRVILIAVVAIAVVVAAVQFLGLGGMFGGVLAGLPIPDLGLSLGGGGGYTMTAVSLSGGNSTPVEVTWDARKQSTVVAPNGESFDAPNGSEFVVVQLNVTNPGNDTLAFRPNYLALATGNSRLGHQPLQGATGQLPLLVEAGSTASGYVVYSVPTDSRSATLLGLPGPDIPPMEFERDRSLSFQVTES